MDVRVFAGLLVVGSVLVLGGCKQAPEAPVASAPAAEAAKAPAPKAVEAQTDVFRAKNELPPGFPADLLVLPGAEIYDSLSAKTGEGRTAFSVRYTVKQKLGDVQAAFVAKLTAAKLESKTETSGPRTSFEFKQGDQLQGRIHLLPTSKIDEVDVQVLAVK